MEKLAALIGDAAGHLSAETGSLASDDKGGLLGQSRGDLDLLENLHGGPIVAVATVKGGGLLQGFVDGLDGLVFEQARRLYFTAAVAYKNPFAFESIQDGGQCGW